MTKHYYLPLYCKRNSKGTLQEVAYLGRKTNHQYHVFILGTPTDLMMHIGFGSSEFGFTPRQLKWFKRDLQQKPKLNQELKGLLLYIKVMNKLLIYDKVMGRILRATLFSHIDKYSFPKILQMEKDAKIGYYIKVAHKVMKHKCTRLLIHDRSFLDLEASQDDESLADIDKKLTHMTQKEFYTRLTKDLKKLKVIHDKSHQDDNKK